MCLRCGGGWSYYQKESNRNPCPQSHRRDYLCTLTLKAPESACESPLAKLQFSLGNLLFRHAEGFRLTKDLTAILAVPRALTSITLWLGRVLHAHGSMQFQV